MSRPKKRRRKSRSRPSREEVLAGLHPAQRRAWERIRRHLERAPGAFTWRDIRRAFYRQRRRCFYCRELFEGGRTPSEATFHIDHRIPVCRGGRNDPTNLCLACPSCNMEKSGAPFMAYVRARQLRGLHAPPVSQRFPLLDASFRADEQARGAPASQAPTARRETPVVIRRRPERGKATRGREPNQDVHDAKSKGEGDCRGKGGARRRHRQPSGSSSRIRNPRSQRPAPERQGVEGPRETRIETPG